MDCIHGVAKSQTQLSDFQFFIMSGAFHFFKVFFFFFKITFYFIYFLKFIYFNSRLITLQYRIGFAIHVNWT